MLAGLVLLTRLTAESGYFPLLFAAMVLMGPVSAWPSHR